MGSPQEYRQKDAQPQNEQAKRCCWTGTGFSAEVLHSGVHDGLVTFLPRAFKRGKNIRRDHSEEKV
jgi:hypothetical protein